MTDDLEVRDVGMQWTCYHDINLTIPTKTLENLSECSNEISVYKVRDLCDTDIVSILTEILYKTSKNACL